MKPCYAVAATALALLLLSIPWVLYGNGSSTRSTLRISLRQKARFPDIKPRRLLAARPNARGYASFRCSHTDSEASFTEHTCACAHWASLSCCIYKIWQSLDGAIHAVE
jgi:hypothetical protein